MKSYPFGTMDSWNVLREGRQTADSGDRRDRGAARPPRPLAGEVHAARRDFAQGEIPICHGKIIKKGGLV